MEVQFHKNFKKRFKKIHPKIQEQFYARPDLFLYDRFAQSLNNHSVDRAYPSCQSINISGDYRAIYKEADDTAIFMTIGTHSELY